MTSYLKKYIERVSEVPAQLHRFFSLVKDLDERAVALDDELGDICLNALEVETQNALQDAEAPPSKRRKQAVEEDKIQAQWKQLISLNEEKVQVAGQTYDFVDSHIRQLDEDLKSLEAEVVIDKQKLLMAEDQSALDIIGQPRRSARTDPFSVQKRKYTKRSSKTGRKPGISTLSANTAAMACDSAEPRYCKCNSISYGSMIACENVDCVIEWFHIGCVGIAEGQMPKGKWYCPDCSPLFQKPAGVKAK